jgi:Zn-dependent protease with chaperone function
MNITATRFATQIRTWLLVAALTGLLIAIGGALGGGALYVFVALAALMNVVGYWFSDKLALAASRARPLGPGEIPRLETLERGSRAIPLNVNPATASMYAVNLLPRQGVSTLFMTHPPIEERIRRLRALDGQGVVRLAA